MAGTITSLEAGPALAVLGETLRPVLTTAMGASVELFDTRGPADAGPPPHSHPWEELYVVLSGELEVTIAGQPHRLVPGGVAHIPANVVHGYRNLSEARFLTLTTRGGAADFFTQVSSEVAMSPPDVGGLLRVAALHDIAFEVHEPGSER